MADFTLSAEMSLPIPTVGIAGGPEWATLLDNCMSIIDGHDHTPGNGAPIPTAALNINADLSMLNNNLINARSIRFQVQSAVNGPLDLGCLYELGQDLYFNDGTGSQIRITQNGTVTGATGTITGLPSGTASASFDAITGTFIFQQATNIAANIDGGSYLFRNTSPNSTNALTLSAPAALGASYALTLPAIPGSNRMLSLTTAGVFSTSAANTIITTDITDGVVTQAKLQPMATGSTVPAGGIATSASSGVYNVTTSTTPITNLSVTITTTGRPVWVGMISDATSPNLSVVNIDTGGGINPGAGVAIQLKRGSTSIASLECRINGSGGNLLSTPVSAFNAIDIVTAGTYTYTATALLDNTTGGGPAATVEFAKLVAYEI